MRIDSYRSHALSAATVRLQVAVDDFVLVLGALITEAQDAGLDELVVCLGQLKAAVAPLAVSSTRASLPLPQLEAAVAQYGAARAGLVVPSFLPSAGEFALTGAAFDVELAGFVKVRQAGVGLSR